jgi:hypothetical protein
MAEQSTEMNDDMKHRPRRTPYDRQSHIGRLDQALNQAGTNGWTVARMKNDWRRVVAFDQSR